jgi:rhodanese-related sulfurtransferase
MTRHIAGALLMPLDELRAIVNSGRKSIALDKPVVVYCGDGARTGPEGTYVMNQAGYAGAVNLKGGLEGWAKAGLPMAAGS